MADNKERVVPLLFRVGAERLDGPLATVSCFEPYVVSPARGYETRRLLAAARRGFASAGWSIIDQVVDRWFDRRTGIRAGGLVTTESLGIDVPGNHDHAATSFLSFRRLMRDLPSFAFEGSFVDLGSGMGRALIMAARYPFRRVIGVELSEALVSVALQNLVQAGLAGDARLSVCQGDAADFPIPYDATVLYLFNPFHGTVLASVLDNLQDVVTKTVKPIFVIVLNPVRFSSVASELPWLVPVRRYRFEFDAVVYHADPASSPRP